MKGGGYMARMGIYNSYKISIYRCLQVKTASGRLVAKAIDVDLSQFRQSLLMTMYHDQLCSSDKDCTFFNCLGECDMTTGTCSGKLKSSNLVVSLWFVNIAIIINFYYDNA